MPQPRESINEEVPTIVDEFLVHEVWIYFMGKAALMDKINLRYILRKKETTKG